MPISDQSMFWGLPAASWDRIGFSLLVAGALLGVFALFASLASSIILYRVGNVAQAELETKTLALENRAEELRSANLELEAQIAPRRLDDTQRGALIFAAAPFAGKKVRLGSYALDVEGAVLTKQIFEALQLAKVNVDTEQAMGLMPFGKIAFGVFVDGPDREVVDALVKALSPVGAQPQPMPHKMAETDASATVFVAAKPPR